MRYAKALYEARRARADHLPDELLGEPAWDMLLLLYFLEAEGRPVTVSGVTASSGVPGTTALRWLQTLTGRGLVKRHSDPGDRRRSWVILSDKGRRAMDRILDRYPPEAG